MSSEVDMVCLRISVRTPRDFHTFATRFAVLAVESRQAPAGNSDSHAVNGMFREWGSTDSNVMNLEHTVTDENTDRSDRNPARLNQIGVLTRREIEARVLEPILEAMVEEFGDRARVEGVAAETIIRLAQEQGNQLAEELGGRSLAHFRESMKYWIQDNALEIEVLEHSEERFDFNVVRCRYAEMYRDLGMADKGALLSCNRDFALIQGFDPDTELTRTQTIMQGAPFCDFRYRKKSARTDSNQADEQD